jgi:hypothetical protein
MLALYFFPWGRVGKKETEKTFQNGGYREEAESVHPKVKSWRDCWRYTLQEKPPRRGKTLTPPYPQTEHNISTPR